MQAYVKNGVGGLFIVGLLKRNFKRGYLIYSDIELRRPVRARIGHRARTCPFSRHFEIQGSFWMFLFQPQIGHESQPKISAEGALRDDIWHKERRQKQQGEESVCHYAQSGFHFYCLIIKR